MIDLRLYLVTGPSPDLAATEALVRAAVAGPIHPTVSKDDAAHPIGYAGIEEVRRRSGLRRALDAR